LLCNRALVLGGIAVDGHQLLKLAAERHVRRRAITVPGTQY
jgi:hypothetical protein